MDQDKEDDEDEQALVEMMAARGLFITRKSADRATVALEPYRKPPEEGLESAIRNLLVDFFHMTQQHDGSAIEAETLKTLVDEAAALYSDEKDIRTSGVGARTVVREYIKAVTRDHLVPE